MDFFAFIRIAASLILILPVFAQNECSSDLGNVLPQAQCGNCGFATDTTAYPFLVAIGYNNSRGNFFYACDGVLINRLYVLTAAGCHTKERPISRILLGYTDFAEHNCTTCLPPQFYNILPESVTVHDGYVEGNIVSNANNLALIRLPYLATTYMVNGLVPVVPICLAFRTDIPLPTNNRTVMAWHRSELIPGNFSQVANRSAEIMFNETCKKIPKYENLDINRHICVVGTNGTSLPCLGQLGAPLVARNDKTMYLQGMLSMASRCGSKRNVPDLYTNIQNYINWIRDNIRY